MVKLFSVYKINLIRNMFQFSIGSVLYFVINNSFDIAKFFVGIAGFLIAYQSVYFFNDLMDYEQDRKDKDKSKIKMFISGKVKKDTGISMMFLFVILGLSLCFIVDQIFGLLVVACLFLNFLHSSNLTTVKKSSFLIPNMFVLEFIKYSLGWFVFSLKIYNFPFFIISLSSAAYVIAYILYKRKNIPITDKGMLSLLAIGGFSLIFSIFFYHFTLPLIVLIASSSLYLFILRSNTLVKIKIGSIISFLAIFAFIASMLFLTIPSIAQINNDLYQNVDTVKNNLTDMVPENIKNEIENINDTINSKIIEIDNAVSSLG